MVVSCFEKYGSFLTFVNFEVVHLDDGDHVTRGKAHLVSSHQELEGVLVNPHLPMFLHQSMD